MGIQKTIKGAKYGKWTLISKVRASYWVALCDCGTNKTVFVGNLKAGKSTSCGCVAKQLTSERTRAHGLSHSAIHNLWTRIRQRCGNPSHGKFSYYGGRGIRVCERWSVFENFYEDMGDIPEGCSLDRIDPNGDYSPNNCRWATKKMQARNTRSNHFVEHDGQRLTLAEWAEIKGINQLTISKRLQRGWPAGDAIERPNNSKLLT